MTWENTPCQPCHGQGYIAVEDVAGMPASHWEPCPFCHGTAHAGWLDDKRANRVDHQTKKRRVLLAVTIGWVFCYGLPPIQMARATYGDAWAWTFLVWVLAGMALVFAWVVTPSSRSANRARTWHAPGFNTNREAAALGLFGAALAARHFLDHDRHQEQQAPPPPPQDVQSSWPAGPQVRYPTAGESVAWNRYRSEGY
jgi:hypothetical protein